MTSTAVPLAAFDKGGINDDDNDFATCRGGANIKHVQGSAKQWSLGCVIPASWPPKAAGAQFTQTMTIL